MDLYELLKLQERNFRAGRKEFIPSVEDEDGELVRERYSRETVDVPMWMKDESED